MTRDHARRHRHAAAPVEHDPERVVSRASVQPRRQRGIVGENGSAPDQDGRDGVAQRVDAAPRLLACDPAALARARRDLAVQAHRPLGDDKGPPHGNPVKEGLVEPAGVRIPVSRSGSDAHTRCPQGIRAATRRWMRVRGRIVDRGHARREEGVGAGGCSPVMVAGFERHIEGSATRLCPCRA